MTDLVVTARDGAGNLATRTVSFTQAVDIPVQFPAGANTVTVGSVPLTLAAIDPPTTDPTQPGGRGANQLIIVSKASTPARNPFGYEVPVGADGRTLAGAVNVPLSVGGYVLSGHGTMATSLKSVTDLAGVGAAVAVTKTIITPSTTHPVMGLYLMDGVGHISQIPPHCNRILVAFYQGTDLVEWGGDSPTQTGTDLTAWHGRRAGNEILISLGGQGGNVVLDQVDEGLEHINSVHFPVDGIDFDAEAFGYNPEQAVAVATAGAAALGRARKDFLVQFVPPGGNPVGLALAAAKAVQDAGFRVTFGQQLYETAINDSDVISATGRAVAALGAPSVLVGMMIGDSHNSWTVANSVSRMRLAQSTWKDIGGAYLWESSRAGTSEVVEGVGALLGVPV